MTWYFQGHYAGGGSGGSIYINCNDLDMTGYMYCKGGSGTSYGAGGSGGRVNVVFHTGHYESGHVITNG